MLLSGLRLQKNINMGTVSMVIGFDKRLSFSLSNGNEIGKNLVTLMYTTVHQSMSVIKKYI